MTHDSAFADSPQLRAARDSWSRGDTSAAISAFEAARRTNPRSVRVRVEYARALGQLYEVVAAEQLLDEALQLAGGDPGLVASVAPHFAAIYRPEKAIELIERLWRRGGATPPIVLNELARLYERSGYTEAAEEAIREVIASAPREAAPKILLARLHRRRKAFDEAAALVRPIAEDESAEPPTRVEALAEWSAIHDGLGDSDAALATIDRAKALQREDPTAKRLAAHSLRVQQALDLLYQRLDQATVGRWREPAAPAPTDVTGFAHILGFPRSGTTLLEQVIAAHPQVFLSSERALFSGYLLPNAMGTTGAPTFSIESLDSISTEQLQQSRRRYVACSEAIEARFANGLVHLDKNPNHTSLVAGIFRIFPESRFLFVVRDPRDVMVSAYLRHFPLTEVSVNFLTIQGLARLYDADMRNWRRFRDSIPGQWLEVRYEDLIDDLPSVASSALELMGLSWDESVGSYRDRLEGRAVNSPSHDAVRKPVYDSAVGRYRSYEKLLAPVQQVLAPWVREFGYE